MRRTKIVCTMGPSTMVKGVLGKMIKSGMNVARFNFSHGDHAEQKERIDLVKKLRQELDKPVALLLDTKGPEIRIRTFENGRIELKDGDYFTLTTEQVEGNNARVAISYADLPKYLKSGDKILVNDGMIELKVDSVGKNEIVTKVVNGGSLSNRKSINIPGVNIDMVYLSPQDKADIKFGIEQDVDYIALSFVRTADDVMAVRTYLKEIGCNNDVKLISKIENRQGVDNMNKIIEVSDGIMVARGDMGVEINFEELPAIQKELIKKCYEAGKIAITATQMLESMTNSPRPTRAETSDVANAVFDGTSATMLSGETAAGRYPVETIKTMAKIIEHAEQAFDYARRFDDKFVKKDISDAVSHATCSGANDLGAKAIIVTTRTGTTARQISRFRPSMPIIAATTSTKTYQQLSLNWGVVPAIATEQHDSDRLFEHAAQCALSTGLVKKGDLVAMTAGVPVGTSGTNIMKMEEIK